VHLGGAASAPRERFGAVKLRQHKVFKAMSSANTSKRVGELCEPTAMRASALPLGPYEPKRSSCGEREGKVSMGTDTGDGDARRCLMEPVPSGRWPRNEGNLRPQYLVPIQHGRRGIGDSAAI